MRELVNVRITNKLCDRTLIFYCVIVTKSENMQG